MIAENGENLAAVINGNRRVIAEYDPDGQILSFYELDGPYTWTFLFTRNYFNRLRKFWRCHTYESEEAGEEAYRIMDLVEQQDEIDLRKILDDSWHHRTMRDLPAQVFDSLYDVIDKYMEWTEENGNTRRETNSG